jgi:uncharacterized protein YciI
VDLLVLSSAVPGAAPDDALTRQHWSYMDRFADGMTARGPTLTPDRASWTGSMHVVSLPSAADAAAFVDDEPYQRAGLFAAHRTWLFTDLLGRTMWEHTPVCDDPRFLVLTSVLTSELTSAGLDLPPDRVLVRGSLTTLDRSPAGEVLAVQVADPSVLAGVGAEVHAWEPGGRR